MGQQRTLGHRPHARGHIVVGAGHPVVGRALGLGLHHRQNLGLSLEPVGFEVGNRRPGLTALTADGVAVRRQDEADAVLVAGLSQAVQRIKVGAHIAIGWINHGGAAVEDVVAAEQQAVFEQQQAQVVGGMARGVDHHQGVGQIALWPLSGQGEQRLVF